MFNKKLAILVVLVMIAPIVLAACGPTPEPVIIKETSVVVETVVVEKEGETVVEEVTAIVEVEKEVVVTATPEPEPTKAALGGLEGLWYPLATEPPTLDTQLATDTTSHLIINQLVEGLFEYRGDGSIEPAGATGFEISDDGLVYTIALRDDAVWSDGVPVTAQHYVDGVVRLLKPETAAEYAWLMYDVKGAEAFNTGETDDPATLGIQAVDDYTLEVELEAPTPYFETVLPFSTFDPVRLDVVEAHGDLWTEPGNYVGNGPYLLDYWEHEAEVGLVKNPNYWDADSVTIESVTLPILVEEATSMALYENNETHTTGEAGYPNEDMPRILEDPVLSEELRILPRPGVYYVGLHTLRPPTDDVNVRKALASAIDRQTIVDNVLNTPWRSILTCTTPPKILGYQEPGTCGYDFDPEAAKQYLADAGYPDGEGFPTLIVWFNRGNEDILEAIAAMWQENLNINVELRTNEWAVYLEYLDQCNNSKEELASCEFNAYRMGWVMDYGDPQNQLEVVFAPSSTFQYTGWENERFDELMDLAGSEFDTATREEYYKEADKILSEEHVAIIPIMGYERQTLVKEGVTFEFPPFGGPEFKYWAVP
jgi:oligopeptide transport system substrate-binding protein